MKKTGFKFFLSLFSLLLASTQLTYAGLFKLTNINSVGTGVPGGGNLALADLIAEEINKSLPSAESQSDFFDGMSNANTLSAAGITTSYAPVFEKFLLGLNVSAGADLGSKNFTDFKNITKNPEQFKGFGFQAAFVLGISAKSFLKASWLESHPLNIYLSGFSMNRKFDDVTTKYFGAGIGLQYKLISEKNWASKSLKWTGIDLSTGFLYSKLDANSSIKLDDTFVSETGGTPFNVNVNNASALLNVNVRTFSIPLEASTGIRLFYIFKLIGGIGADLSLGNTSGTGSLSPGNTVTALSGGNGISAEGELNLDGSKGPNLINPRFFFGPQIEFGIGSVSITLHKSLRKNAIAVNSGVNFFW